MIIFPKTAKIFDNQGHGKVLKAVSAGKQGRVRFQATDWPAKLYAVEPQQQSQIMVPDCQVRVIGREGLTLLVTPESLIE